MATHFGDIAFLSVGEYCSSTREEGEREAKGNRSIGLPFTKNHLRSADHRGTASDPNNCPTFPSTPIPPPNLDIYQEHQLNSLRVSHMDFSTP